MIGLISFRLRTMVRGLGFGVFLVSAFGVAPVHGQGLPRLRPVLNLRIDPASADLTQVGEMMVSRTGEIIVTQWQDKVIRVFSATGTESRIGRAGEGPGEFRNLRLAGLVGDSVWVEDPALDRVSVFGPDHKFARSFRFPNAVTGTGTTLTPAPVIDYVSPVALFGDGTVLLNVVLVKLGNPSIEWTKGIPEGATVVLRTGEDGSFRRRVTVISRTMACQIEYQGGASHIPFCAEPITSLFTGTTDLVTVEAKGQDTKVPSYLVTVLDPDGRARYSRTYAYTPVPVPRATSDSARQLRLKNLAKNPAGTAAMSTLKFPVTFPPVRAMVVGRDGTLWLEERTSGAGHRWKVLDAKGNPVATVTLPEAVSIRVADRHMVWGLETDGDGLQGIVRYRLEPAR